MKLIKLNEEHYIIVDDSAIKEGDMFINEHNQISVCVKSLEKYLKNNTTNTIKKVTHSTKPLEDIVTENSFKTYGFIRKQEIEELLFGYSVEKLVDESFENMGYHSTVTPYEEDQFKLGYKLGFSAHKELTKDKLFTLEDMINFAVNCFNDNYDEDISFYKRVKINIEYLKPKTEWEVEFINGKLTLKQ